jgi:thiol-disulfide isomerase/thioredoxin
MKTLQPCVFTLLGLLVLTGAPIQGIEAEDADSQPKIIAVKFHADWCGACKAMGSVFTDLRNKLDGEPVLFVELDFTNATTRHQAMLLASALGISPALKENPGTGFILLFDKKRQVTGKHTSRQTLKEIAAAICTHCE